MYQSPDWLAEFSVVRPLAEAKGVRRQLELLNDKQPKLSDGLSLWFPVQCIDRFNVRVA